MNGYEVRVKKSMRSREVIKKLKEYAFSLPAYGRFSDQSPSEGSHLHPLQSAFQPYI